MIPALIFQSRKGSYPIAHNMYDLAKDLYLSLRSVSR